MADIFLSYRRADRLLAAPLVDRLKAEGFSVWWDDDITPRKAWDATIEEQINAAASVVVLWTPRSVESDWVRTEAHYGHRRNKLAPVKLESCTLPIAFSLVQTIDLTEWAGDADDKQWRRLLVWLSDLRTPRQGSTTAAAPGRFHMVVDHTAAGEPVVDGAFVSAATPAGTLFRDAPDAPVMRVLPAGAFMMGATPADPDRTGTEAPQKRIEIPRPFALGFCPVTAGEYARFRPEAAVVEAPPRRRFGWFGGQGRTPTATLTVEASTGDASAPVSNVSFNDAAAYAKQLSVACDAPYRLPSEAEWEYACRAGSMTRYYWGDEFPSEGGRGRANAFGLFDMHGVVREWTLDYWHDALNLTPADGSPYLEGHAAMRAVRGGALGDPPAMQRSCARGRATQHLRSPEIGFRILRVLQ